MMKDEIDLIINEVNEKKGEDVLFVDIEKGIHPVTDNIVVVSALNKIHLNALVDGILRLYKDNKKDKLKDLDYLGLSGKPESKWVILDFNNLLIHIMEKDIRQLYDFDNLFAGYEVYRYH